MRYIRTAAVATMIGLGAPADAASTVDLGAGLRQSAPATGVLRVARFSTMAVRDLLESEGYRVIGEITFNGTTYIVNAFDRKGQRVKLYVDPSTIKILKMIIYK